MPDDATPVVTKAVLIAYTESPAPGGAKGGDPQRTEDDRKTVQFNPTTLKVTMSTSLENKPGSGGDRNSAAQFVDKSSSSLTVDLLFDTSLDFTDVRTNTKWIAENFLKPGPAKGKKLTAPKKCRFQWGTFAFDGMVSAYTETLDFFAPEGVPLRATVSLTLSEDKFQFETGKAADAPTRNPPTFAGVAPDTPLPKAAQDVGEDPKDWRDTALYNGIETPRFPGSLGVAVPVSGSISASIEAAGGGITGGISAGLGGGASLSGGVGFSVGASATLGTGIAGASFSVGT